MKLQHTHTGKNSPTRIIQRKPIRNPNIQIPTTSSPIDLHDDPHTRTIMTQPNVQNLEKQPHTETHTEEDTTNPSRQIENDNIRSTTPTTTWKVQEKTSKWTGLGGGRNRLEESTYKGLWVIELHMDGPIAQPA